MTINLAFTTEQDGNVSVKMMLGGNQETAFSYVAFVKYLFEKPDTDIECSFDDGYDDDQIERLRRMVDELKAAANPRTESSDSPSHIDE